MRTVGLLLLIILIGGGQPISAQLSSAPPGDWNEFAESDRSAPSSNRSLQHPSNAPDASLSHVVGREATLFNRADSTAPVATLSARTPLHRLDCSGAWCRVRTDDGQTGYMAVTSISNVWIRVSKAERRLYLYRGPTLVETFNIDIGYNTFADKRQQGSRARRDHWRTPEGTFYVVDKNPQSEFYKALVLNYPTISDADRGLKQDLISRQEYEAIVQAQRQFRMPPMDTDLGGWIEIHGEGTGASTNWTQGCVAVQNSVMNRLWVEVPIGTPVLVE